MLRETPPLSPLTPAPNPTRPVWTLSARAGGHHQVAFHPQGMHARRGWVGTALPLAKASFGVHFHFPGSGVGWGERGTGSRKKCSGFQPGDARPASAAPTCRPAGLSFWGGSEATRARPWRSRLGLALEMLAMGPAAPRHAGPVLLRHSLGSCVRCGAIGPGGSALCTPSWPRSPLARSLGRSVGGRDPGGAGSPASGPPAARPLAAGRAPCTPGHPPTHPPTRGVAGREHAWASVSAPQGRGKRPSLAKGCSVPVLPFYQVGWLAALPPLLSLPGPGDPDLAWGVGWGVSLRQF